LARRIRHGKEDKGHPSVNEGDSVQLSAVEVEDQTISFYTELIRVRDNDPCKCVNTSPLYLV
jgi:hypothetical protein